MDGSYASKICLSGICILITTVGLQPRASAALDAHALAACTRPADPHTFVSHTHHSPHPPLPTPTTHPLHVHILTYRHLTHVVHMHFPWLHRYSNIFVTSPSPENLRTLFEFVFKGFDALHYSEHEDYELVQSTNPEFNKAIVRVNIFHDHRQTIQVCMCLLWGEGRIMCK